MEHGVPAAPRVQGLRPKMTNLPFIADMAPESFKARGERFAKAWALYANSLYAGFTSPTGRNLGHDVAMDKAARRANVEAGKSRRLSV